MLFGVFGFNALLPRVQQFYDSTARGALTLDQWLRLDSGAVVFIVTAIAIGGFAGATALERRFGERA
jgi:hypothetical protein